MAGRTVTYTFVADVDNFEKPLEGARRKASEFFTGVQKDLARLTNGKQLAGAFKDIGETMTKAFTLPIVAGFGAVIKASSDFDKEMTKSLAIMGPISDSLRRKMEENARSVAKTFGVSHAEAARSYYSLASAGMSAQQSMAALPTVAQFAKAGMMEMGQATDLLVSSQTALGLSSKDPIKNQLELAHVSDVLVNANNGAIGSVQQFAEALSNKAAAAMRTYHVSVEQGTAVLMAYAQAGIQGATAGERYDILLRELTGAALKHADAFKAAKIAVFDHTGALRPMGDVIGDIEKRFTGMSDAQRVTELGLLGIKAKSQSAILGLLGMSQAIKDNEKALFVQGSTALVAQKQMQSFSEQLNLLKVAAVDVAISLGQSLLPVAQRMVKVAKDDLVPAIEGAVKWFKDLPPGVQDAAIGFTAFLAVLGPGIYVIGSAATAIGTLTRAAKVLMATNIGTTISTWVASLAGGAGLVGVLGSAGAALSGFLAVAVPWGVAATAVFFAVYESVKRLVDAIPGLRAAADLEMANVYRFATGTKGTRDLEDPMKNPALGQATRNYFAGGGSSMIPGSIRSAAQLEAAVVKANNAVTDLNENLGKPAKKGFLQEYLEDFKKIPQTAAQIATAVRESIVQGAARAGYAALIATALAGMTPVTGHAGSVNYPTAQMPTGWNGGSDYAPGIATLGSGNGWYNHAGEPGYAKATVQSTSDFGRALRTAADAVRVLGLSASRAGQILGLAQVGFASGQDAKSVLNGRSFGSLNKTDKVNVGMSGLQTAIGAYQSGSVLGGAAAGAAFGSQVAPGIGTAIGAAIGGLLGLFGHKKAEPPPPPKPVDEATWRDFQSSQLNNAMAGLAAAIGRRTFDDNGRPIMGDDGQQVTGGGIRVTSAADLAAQASIAGQQFWAIFKTEGIVAAAAAAKDVIARLVEQLGQYGSKAATAILGPIQQQIALAGNEAFSGAASGAQGFAEVLSAQVNARMPMAISQFDAYGQQAKAAFEQAKQAAIDQGLSIEDANRAAYAAAGPLIQAIIDAAAQYGITLDENTQSLVDQAGASGVAFSTSSTDRLIMSVDALTLALGGVPPAINAITSAVGGIPTERDVNVRLHYHQDHEPPPPLEPDPPGFAGGSGGLRDFGVETTARLHGREAVLTESEFRGLTSMASRGSSTVQFGDINIHVADGADVAEIQDRITEGVKRAVVDGGLLTFLQDRLGVRG